MCMWMQMCICCCTLCKFFISKKWMNYNCPMSTVSFYNFQTLHLFMQPTNSLTSSLGLDRHLAPTKNSPEPLFSEASQKLGVKHQEEDSELVGKDTSISELTDRKTSPCRKEDLVSGCEATHCSKARALHTRLDWEAWKQTSQILYKCCSKQIKHPFIVVTLCIQPKKGVLVERWNIFKPKFQREI